MKAFAEKKMLKYNRPRSIRLSKGRKSCGKSKNCLCGKGFQCSVFSNLSEFNTIVLTGHVFGLVGYFRLFIVATGCPSDGYLLRGIVQGYRTKLLRAPPGSLTCSAYSTVTRDFGLTSHPKGY